MIHSANPKSTPKISERIQGGRTLPMNPNLKRNSAAAGNRTSSSGELKLTTRAFTPVKHAVAGLILLAISPGPTQAQKTTEQGLPVVYNDVTAGISTLDRDARKAYAGKFRLVEVTESDGLTPARIKGHTTPFKDPRSMRDWAVPGKVVYLFVVTADGRVIEPRIVQSTDRRVSEHVIKSILVRRFVPARFRGVKVSSLHADDIDFGSRGPDENRLYKNGLGIQGSRDR
jgi:hypothetical protein